VLTKSVNERLTKLPRKAALTARISHRFVLSDIFLALGKEGSTSIGDGADVLADN
jgi:hypothetical protein